MLLCELVSVLLCTGAEQGKLNQTPRAGIPRFSDGTYPGLLLTGLLPVREHIQDFFVIPSA